MYPGLNYESLAKYLEQPDLIHQSSHKDGNQVGKKGPQHALTLESWHKKQDYVSTYDLNVAASQDRVNHFSEIASFMKHVETQRSISTTHNALVFMRGYSSPSWLKVVGSSYRVDPEFLQRHLQIRSSIGEPDYFALPSLPSSSSNTIRLRVTTIGAWERSGCLLGQNEIDRLRADSAEAMDDYKDEVRRGHSLMVGSSIVRQFSAFDGENFAIEQDISMCQQDIQRMGR